MINRHRVPTVFSIYMLDVICCALGCVILLWQVAHNEAEEQTAAALRSSSAVSSANAQLESLYRSLAESRRDAASLRDTVTARDLDLEKLNATLRQSQRERDEGTRLLALRKSEYEKLQQAYLASAAILKTVRAERDKLDKAKQLALDELATRINANAKLLLELTASEQKVTTLTKTAAARKLDAAEAAKRLAEQLARLQEVESRNTALAKQATALKAERKELQAKLTTRELEAKILAQDVERSKKELEASAGDTARTIAALQKDRTLLTERVRTVQAEADERFAGIALTGQNVLFLVDMSGSMAMRDEKTADPDKWPLVCEAVAQLMRSIRTLRYFQVVAFSDGFHYPLGGAETWLKFNPAESPKRTLAALKKIEPAGETNMHAVFGEAFRYREAKLDTMYVFSDGLPNAGNGISRDLSEPQRTSILSKHLREKLRTDWNRPLAGQARVRINSIGFFFESPDVGAFLWALSREHGGSFVGMNK